MLTFSFHDKKKHFFVVSASNAVNISDDFEGSLRRSKAMLFFSGVVS